MNLVQLLNKLLYEGLIERDIADVLSNLIIFLCRFADPGQLRLQQQKALVAHLILKRLTHEVGQEGPNFKLHVFVHGPDLVVVHEQVFLDFFGFTVTRGLIVVRNPLFQLLVEELTDLVVQLDARHFDFVDEGGFDVALLSLGLRLLVDVAHKLTKQMLD